MTKMSKIHEIIDISWKMTKNHEIIDISWKMTKNLRIRYDSSVSKTGKCHKSVFISWKTGKCHKSVFISWKTERTGSMTDRLKPKVAWWTRHGPLRHRWVGHGAGADHRTVVQWWVGTRVMGGAGSVRDLVVPRGTAPGPNSINTTVFRGSENGPLLWPFSRTRWKSWKNTIFDHFPCFRVIERTNVVNLVISDWPASCFGNVSSVLTVWDQKCSTGHRKGVKISGKVVISRKISRFGQKPIQKSDPFWCHKRVNKHGF